MKDLETAVPARYFAQLIDFLEASGTPCRDALSAAQVRSLNDPQSKLTTSQVDALIGEAARLSGRSDLGFELGRLIKLNSHDVLGYAIISCPTLDHMLRLVARYYRLMTPMFEMRYQRHGLHAELDFLPARAMAQPTLRFYLDMLALSFHGQIAAVTQGRQAPYDLFLSMPAPPHLKRYRDLKGVRVHFNEDALPGLRVKMTTELFDEALAMTDLRALSQAEARCKLLMQEVSAHGRWSEWVAMMLRQAEDCQPALDELAQILNISTRTLDRYLSREGASFRDLSVTIRNERACELLVEGRQAISQIAYRLGYTDIANFSRSFKKLNGMSPSAYMERAAAHSATRRAESDMSS
ncbi:MAG: AraC family transcriptional regulator ligand-binding domain-containing protein [Pseudomonadota bacterium]